METRITGYSHAYLLKSMNHEICKYFNLQSERRCREIHIHRLARQLSALYRRPGRVGRGLRLSPMIDQEVAQQESPHQHRWLLSRDASCYCEVLLVGPPRILFGL